MISDVETRNWIILFEFTFKLKPIGILRHNCNRVVTMLVGAGHEKRPAVKRRKLRNPTSNRVVTMLVGAGHENRPAVKIRRKRVRNHISCALCRCAFQNRYNFFRPNHHLYINTERLSVCVSGCLYAYFSEVLCRTTTKLGEGCGSGRGRPSLNASTTRCREGVILGQMGSNPYS